MSRCTTQEHNVSEPVQPGYGAHHLTVSGVTRASVDNLYACPVVAVSVTSARNAR